MASKSANVYARIEPDVKEQAENILASLGVSASNAINMFYKQIILHKGIPFDVTLDVKKPLSIEDLTKEELNQELMKGYNDMINGRTRPIDEAFADICQEYNL